MNALRKKANRCKFKEYSFFLKKGLTFSPKSVKCVL